MKIIVETLAKSCLDNIPAGLFLSTLNTGNKPIIKLNKYVQTIVIIIILALIKNIPLIYFILDKL